METLQQYLDRAEDFLTGSQSDHVKKRILHFCKKHGLDKDFETLLKENPEWCLLAKTHQVKYFIDHEPFKKKKVNSRAEDKPEISLNIFHMGMDPTIKIHVSERGGYF